MNVGQLREALSGWDDEIEVRLAVQPSWPFEHGISEVVKVDPSEAYYTGMDTDGQWYVYDTSDESTAAGPFESWEAAEADLAVQMRFVEVSEPIVYIAEATQLGYLPSAARGALSW